MTYNNKIKDCIIIGAGTYGQVYAKYLSEDYNIIGYLDDNVSMHGTIVGGYKVLGFIKELFNSDFFSPDSLSVFVPIGNNPLRVSLLKKINLAGFNTPSYIHSNTVIDSSVEINDPVYILPGTSIMPHSKLFPYVMISMGVNIAHHTTIEEGCFFSQGSNIGASILIKENAYIGIASTIMTGVKIVGDNSLIGAGAVVIRDVPNAAVMVGVPAVVKKYKGNKMNDKIWLSSPHMGGSEEKYVNEAFRTNWVAPLGPNVNNFEFDLASYTKTGYAAALSSGTASLHLALIMLGVGPGDEVICQSMTFSASANPIAYLGATPVFVDSEKETWNMCPVLLNKAIKDRIAKGKTPKAIIPVHLYGMPAQMDKIMAVAKNYKIPVVEDAAEALGSRIKNKAMGSYGEMGVLSFNGNKIITTSGGGALLSNDKTLIEKARFLATQARDEAPHYQHSEIGYNYRMSNISAGIGRGQMEVLDKHIELRRENFNTYKKEFANIDGISLLEEPNGYFSNRWLSALVINPELSNGVTKEDLMTALLADNIESRPLWKPMHLQPVFAGSPSYVNGTSEYLFENGLCLPSGSNLSKEDLDRVCSIIKRTFANAKETVSKSVELS